MIHELLPRAAAAKCYLSNMNAADHYLEINRQSWNNRTDTHLQSAFYDMEGFLNGRSSLNPIELPLLGDVKGKSILHLQCHFGQDSISLARMGATVTGVDLSDKAIASARQIASDTRSDATFICCDVYDLPAHLEGEFDIVFTSYGTIGWLPDLDRWAAIVSKYLKQGGSFVFVEFHPVVWMFDNDFEKIAYSYFNTGAIVETESGTYADKAADITQQYVMWNHGMGEVVNSLVRNDLSIQSLDEFDYSPYNCFAHTVEVAPGQYRISHLDNKIPMVYAIRAVRSPSRVTPPG
jgi:2-polyprenyl-3-methyl-5-hydroxy-6-metoxy-1,4-benzoquinol methylase